MTPEVIILYLMCGALTALYHYTFDDDMTGPEGIVIAIVWPISIVATIVIGAIRLIRRFTW